MKTYCVELRETGVSRSAKIESIRAESAWEALGAAHRVHPDKLCRILGVTDDVRVEYGDRGDRRAA